MEIKIILCIWLGIIITVYLFMWVETLYYKYDFPRVFHSVIEAFTEED